jgi:hypothetical protein
LRSPTSSSLNLTRLCRARSFNIHAAILYSTHATSAYSKDDTVEESE